MQHKLLAGIRLSHHKQVGPQRLCTCLQCRSLSTTTSFLVGRFLRQPLRIPTQGCSKAVLATPYTVQYRWPLAVETELCTQPGHKWQHNSAVDALPEKPSQRHRCHNLSGCQPGLASQHWCPARVGQVSETLDLSTKHRSVPAIQAEHLCAVSDVFFCSVPCYAVLCRAMPRTVLRCCCSSST